MSGILRMLAEVSVFSGILFAALLLVKRLLAKKLSPSLQYFLWFLLLARLLLPVTAESGFHLFTLPYAQTYPAEQMNALPDAAGEAAARSILSQPAGKTAPSPASVLLVIWIGGVAAASGATLRNYLWLRRGIRCTGPLPRAAAETLCAVKRELGITRHVDARICDALKTPALTASAVPKILLPPDILRDPERLRFALMHELLHFKRYDHVICMLISALRAIYWFNPAVWLMQPCIKSDMEASCDSAAARMLDEKGKRRYAAAILDMISGGPRPRLVLGMSLKGNRKTAEKRLRSVFMRHETRAGGKALSLALAGILFAACFTTACMPRRAADGTQYEPQVLAKKAAVPDEDPDAPAYAGNTRRAGGEGISPLLQFNLGVAFSADEVSEIESQGGMGRILEQSLRGEYGVSVTAAEHSVSIVLAADTLFDSGKAELRDETAERQLASIGGVVGAIAACADESMEISILSYTDDTPAPTTEFMDTLDLSAARANNIARYLIAAGVPAELLHTVGADAQASVSSGGAPEEGGSRTEIEITAALP